MSMFLDDCRPSVLRRRHTATAAAPAALAQEDYGTNKQIASAISFLLPCSIRSRLPSVSSVARGKRTAPTSSPWCPLLSSGASTPLTETETLIADIDDDLYAPQFMPGYADAPYALRTPSMQPPSRGSVVEWKCARLGLELIKSSMEESKNATAPGLDTAKISHDLDFERSAYLDGLSYLLRGLPRDLEEAEISILRKALPSSVLDTSPSTAHNAQRQLVRPGRGEAQNHGRPSGVHRATRLISETAVVWFCILWPYILGVVRWMAAYERKHKISSQVVAQCAVVAVACGKWSAGISQSLLYDQRNGTTVGKTLTDTVAWTVHDMVSGMAEGVQDGFSQAGWERRS